MPKKSTPNRSHRRLAVERALRRRTRQIRAAIETLTLVCSGTLSTRTKVCGHKTCRCAADPTARHGPYYEWTRRVDGRYRHSVVSPQQAELLERGIANYREIQRLLRLWEAETAATILDDDELKH
jgi:hypothetical protein